MRLGGISSLQSTVGWFSPLPVFVASWTDSSTVCITVPSVAVVVAASAAVERFSSLLPIEVCMFSSPIESSAEKSRDNRTPARATVLSHGRLQYLQCSCNMYHPHLEGLDRRRNLCNTVPTPCTNNQHRHQQHPLPPARFLTTPPQCPGLRPRTRFSPQKLG